MTTSPRVLIAGASGVVGRAALQHFAGLADTHGLSRRPPDTDAGSHHRLDLTDPVATRQVLADLPPITHLVFAALYEQPGLLAGWVDPEQMETNRRMLANCLDGLGDHPLEHVSLLQGTKAYGAHVQRMRVPGREREPRVLHPNFYWLQEDLLKARAVEAGFAWTIWRPPVIIGHALGAPMNLLAALGAYATICAETGEPFGFPGGACGPIDVVDARLLARAFAWATQAPQARNATFNVTNGDVLHWPDLWPELAAAFGLPVVDATPRVLAEWLPARADAWDRVRARERLTVPDLPSFVGDSAIYTDMLFGQGRTTPPAATLLSTIAIRQAGFAECIDSADMMREWIEALQAARALPTSP
ncbi:MAG TPA: NAD-dependent epimerase/dehydratase family protein [Pseudomonadales bacterium]|nr:NAD-dependent epimerase/dehydratase family protein [Pseudomonadales bacterium]